MIPLWLITKLPFLAKAGPFFGKYGIRILLITGLAVSLFVGGCMYSDKQHAEHAADFERAKVVAIAAREKELNDEWLIRLGEEETARADLQTGFNALLVHRDGLLEQIRNTPLTKPIEDATIEACLETEDENVKLVIANPFNSDFVRLYNDGSSGITRTDGEAGPEASGGNAEVRRRISDTAGVLPGADSRRSATGAAEQPHARRTDVFRVQGEAGRRGSLDREAVMSDFMFHLPQQQTVWPDEAAPVTYDQIKFLQEHVIKNAFARIFPASKSGDLVFHWYVGHDPYNSADNVAFMRRLEPACMNS